MLTYCSWSDIIPCNPSKSSIFYHMETNKTGRPPKPYKIVRRHISIRKETDERLRKVADEQRREFSAQVDLAINMGLDAMERDKT